MHRFLRVFSLLLVLWAPLSRAAEGADDLARSLAELGGAPLAEPLDGGIGDDPCDALVSTGPGLPAGFLPWNGLPEWMPALAAAGPAAPLARGSGALNSRSWPFPSPRATAERLAWLGRFRI